MDAARGGEFYIFTHDEYREYMKLRFDGILAAVDRHAERYRSGR